MSESERYVVTRLSAEEHARILATGCDPHCHACLRKIEIGDLYTMKVFQTGLERMLEVPLGGVSVEGAIKIRGTCCERCAHEDRDLAPGEREAVLGRFKLTLVDKSAPAAEKPAPRKGCFQLPDGRTF